MAYLHFRKMSRKHYGSSGISVEGENELFYSIRNKPICTDYLPPRAKDDFIDLETFFIPTISSLAFNFVKTTIPVLIPCCQPALDRKMRLSLILVQKFTKAGRKTMKKYWERLCGLPKATFSLCELP